MRAVQFPEVNMNFGGTGYNTLPTYYNKESGLLVNCFELSPYELAVIQDTKKIWIHHLSKGSLQPFSMVAVDDYFSNVIHDHKTKQFHVNETELPNEIEAEKLLNKNKIMTPIQTFLAHMKEKHGLTLDDADAFEIAKIAKTMY